VKRLIRNFRWLGFLSVTAARAQDLPTFTIQWDQPDMTNVAGFYLFIGETPLVPHATELPLASSNVYCEPVAPPLPLSVCTARVLDNHPLIYMVLASYSTDGIESEPSETISYP
jgi:hypothetical protein